MPVPLKPHLQTFADAYEGKAHDAADKAGISHQYGRRLVMSATSSNIQPACIAVQEAIKHRQDTEVRPETIKTRQQRQEFWSNMMEDEEASNSDKLRASELLGKSEIDFVERHINQELTLTDIAARVGVQPLLEHIEHKETENE